MSDLEVAVNEAPDNNSRQRIEEVMSQVMRHIGLGEEITDPQAEQIKRQIVSGQEPMLADLTPEEESIFVELIERNRGCINQEIEKAKQRNLESRFFGRNSL